MKGSIRLFYDISNQINEIEDKLQGFKTKEDRKTPDYLVLRGKISVLRDIYNKLYRYEILN